MEKQRMHTLRMVMLAMMVAIGVVISPILRIEGMCPTAHLVTIRSVCILCFSIVFSSLKYKADHKQRIPGKKFPGCCSLPLDFGGRSSLTSSHSENTDSHRLHDPSGKISGTSPSCQTLRRSPSCPLFRRSSQKERISRQTPRRHALISQSLRWHYPNQVRSKIYLPLSLSHKLPLALFFSVPQYSTPLFHCQRIMKHQLCTGCFCQTNIQESYFEISSIRRSSSSVNGAQWIAFTLSRICCGLEAPMSTPVTSS